jgi:hypothetical protein
MSVLLTEGARIKKSPAGWLPQGGGVSGTLLQAKKKALQSKTFLNFGAPRETRTPTPFENGF